MALNSDQRKALDNQVLNFLKTHADVSFYANEIKKSLNTEEGYTISSVTASIRRLRATNPIMAIPGERYRYFYKENCVMVCLNHLSFTKDKNKLYIDGVDRNECYYDFITKKFVTKNNAEPIFTGKYQEAFMKLPNYPEWMFNYTTYISVIDNICHEYDAKIVEKMPANLYEFLQKKYNGTLNVKNFEEFIYITKYKKYYKLVSQLADYSTSFSTSALDKVLEKYTFQNLLKMIQIDIIDGNFSSVVGKLLDFIRKYAEVSILEEPVVDVNRGISVNIDNFQRLLNSKKDELLKIQLQKLNFINGYSNDKFIVVVPQNQRDKQEEGKQQNNCIGYYYDNSIRRGENFIYFIRKKDNPQHSYVTCRFNKPSNKTVEVRIKNNYSLTEEDAKKFVQEVSNIIKEHKNSL